MKSPIVSYPYPFRLASTRSQLATNELGEQIHAVTTALLRSELANV